MYNPADNLEFFNRNINLDITHRCVLQCPRCIRHFKPGLHKRGHDLAPKDFKKICKDFRNVLMCGQMGDPIYHANFHDLLDVAIESDTNLQISTNGHGKKDIWWNISYEKTRQLSTHRWIFGVDGLPKDSHNHRINQDGEAVFKKMVQGAAEGNNVYWQYIVFSYNENDIEEAEKMAIDNGITFMMTESSRWLSKDDPLRPSKHFVNRIIGREFEMMGKLNDS
jgi:MoaA/NifB/PqqE/SkfB family radical SAM enzyme